MKSSEVLRKAGDVIRERGWHRGSFYDKETGAVCAWGAVNVAVRGHHRTEPGGDGSDWNALEHMQRLIPGYADVSLWNDSRGRTVEDVLDLFERAAAVAEESGD